MNFVFNVLIWFYFECFLLWQTITVVAGGSIFIYKGQALFKLFLLIFIVSGFRIMKISVIVSITFVVFIWITRTFVRRVIFEMFIYSSLELLLLLLMLLLLLWRNVLSVIDRKSVGFVHYTLFFIKNTFISNTRLKLAKNQAKTKQHHETELLLSEHYWLCSSTCAKKSVSVVIELYDWL